MPRSHPCGLTRKIYLIVSNLNCRMAGWKFRELEYGYFAIICLDIFNVFNGVKIRPL